jgi:hypothetical protein
MICKVLVEYRFKLANRKIAFDAFRDVVSAGRIGRHNSYTAMRTPDSARRRAPVASDGTKNEP